MNMLLIFEFIYSDKYCVVLRYTENHKNLLLALFQVGHNKYWWISSAFSFRNLRKYEL